MGRGDITLGILGLGTGLVGLRYRAADVQLLSQPGVLVAGRKASPEAERAR